jgi:hypothetical protein
MIVYNVTIKVEADSSEAWLQWMKETHIADMMNTGLFLEHKLCRLLEQDETDGLTFVVQYLTESMENYQTYISEYADDMRKKGKDKFGEKFMAFRTIMEVVQY